MEIELTNEKGWVLGRDTFTSKHPTEPGLGSSVYFDVNTGPVPYFDQEYAITVFKFEVTQEGEVVAIGSGKIVD